MSRWKIYNEDAVQWARDYHKAKFHALLCDAPYHLTSITKRFGKKGSAPAKFGTDGVFSRSSKGFMGTQWDGGDLAFRPETWEAFSEVLHPGAFGMAFSASRNWHRMAVAIEDAGFILHPTIFLWSYGQGFPKATNISKQIDKDKNNSRSEDKRIVLAKHIKQIRTQKGISKKTLASWFSYSSVTENWERSDSGGRWPSSSDYKTLVNRMGCNESLLEDIVENERLVLEHSNNGIGFSNLGSAGYNKEFDVSKSVSNLGTTWEGHRYGLQALKPAVEPIICFQKRYEGKPVDNMLFTGAGALNIDGARIPVNGESVIINRFTDGAKPWGNGAGHAYDTESTRQGRWPANLILTEESAERLDEQSDNTSRFFYNVSTKLDESDPVYYCAKAGRRERDAGLEGTEAQNSVVQNTSGRRFNPICDHTGKRIQVCNCGACEWNKETNPKVHNPHPTVKPIDLMRYLATLLLPPIEYAPRRIFIPFAGVASEMIGAGLAGWEHVVGVENNTENNYVAIAEKRLEHWLK
jgi:hypothetical protein